MESSGNDTLEWREEWAWVAGYSAVAVLVVVFNLIIFFSVAKNSFLYYSTHYVILALSIRNILRVALTLCIVYLTKLVSSYWVLDKGMRGTRGSMPGGEPLICDVLCSLDTWLATLHLYYLAALAIHMFTRYPNPQLVSNSDTALKVYGQMASLNKGVLPVKERCWQAPLLILVPPLLALVLSLPAPIFQISHNLKAVPTQILKERDLISKAILSLKEMPDDIKIDGICSPDGAENLIYQTCSLILGFLLPAILLIFLVLGLAVRRCISCSGGSCVSSWCKEEALLALLLLPSLAAHFLLNLPIIDQYLGKLGLSEYSGLASYIQPETARAVEMSLGLLLPLALYLLLPAYRKFESEPDASDVFKRGATQEKDTHYYRTTITAPRADSEASEEL